jgi:hypothetical protein
VDVVVTPLFEHGRRVAKSTPESWGELNFNSRERFRRATLKKMRSVHLNDWALPPLWDAMLHRWAPEWVELRGYERTDSGWCVQIWSCRIPNSVEVQLQFGTGESTSTPFGIYLRWWREVQAMGKASVEITEIAKRLDLPHDVLMKLIHWAVKDKRAYLHGSRDADALGCVAIHSDAERERLLIVKEKFGH